MEWNACNGTGSSWCAASPGPSLSIRLARKQKQIKMAPGLGGVDLMLVLRVIEADDSVVENEMLLEDDDSTLLFNAVIPFKRRSLNRVVGFYAHT